VAKLAKMYKMSNQLP